MKSRSFLVAFISVVISYLLPSCTKEDVQNAIQNSSVSVGFQIAGVPIILSIGGGNGLYYPQSAYNNYVYGPNYQPVTACYVTAKPYNSESIVVYDSYGRQIGTVRCDQGVGSQTGQLYNALLHWFDNHAQAVVNVQWEPRPFTNGPWSGTMIG